MAEEHRCEAPEGHRLCANNCGFFGSPATMNLCSKCYRDVLLNEQEQAKTKSTIQTALSSAVATAAVPPPIAVDPLPQQPLILTSADISPDSSGSASASVAAAGPVVSAVQPNRCATCRKRVGLTGFKCRCGTTFCGAHRYPEKHGCAFNFKAVGREEIARANPVIKADKLEKI